KRELAESIQMPKSEDLSVPLFGLLNVAHRAGNLRNRSETRCCHHGVLHLRTSLLQGAALGSPEPATQRLAVGQTELPEHVRHVDLDAAAADAAALRKLAIGQPVLNGMRHLPFRGRQHVIVRWPASALAVGHLQIRCASCPNFPTLADELAWRPQESPLAGWSGCPRWRKPGRCRVEAPLAATRPRLWSCRLSMSLAPPLSRVSRHPSRMCRQTFRSTRAGTSATGTRRH